MTCNKDCKNCVYGDVKPRTVVCGSNTTTCAGNCDNCIFAIVIEYNIKCKKN